MVGSIIRPVDAACSCDGKACDANTAHAFCAPRSFRPDQMTNSALEQFWKKIATAVPTATSSLELMTSIIAPFRSEH
jgi:hypothetical protein